jgi:hypothetical protein
MLAPSPTKLYPNPQTLEPNWLADSHPSPSNPTSHYIVSFKGHVNIGLDFNPAFEVPGCLINPNCDRRVFGFSHYYQKTTRRTQGSIFLKIAQLRF